MKYLEKEITLRNQVKMPRLALGTWFIETDYQAEESVSNALKVGYRHIDINLSSHNSRGIGIALKKSNIERNNIFLTVKLENILKNEGDIKKSIEKAMLELNTKYLDLVLIPDFELTDQEKTRNLNQEVWGCLEDLYNEKKIRALGVIDFNISKLRTLIKESKVIPFVNQQVIHIGNTNIDLIQFNNKNRIVTEAYSPVTHGLILREPKVGLITKKYNVSFSQLCMRYDWQLGLAIWRQTTSVAHMKENADLGFTISESDMDFLKSLRI